MKTWITLLSTLFFIPCYLTASSLDTLPLPEFVKENFPKAVEEKEGLYYVIEEQGEGERPSTEDYVLVKFKGSNLKGETFDQSEEEPFIFQLGRRQVIKGWDALIPLFPKGSKVKMLMSSDFAYGTVGAGRLVPPNSPVMFDVEILRILNESEYDDYMVELEERERARYKAMVEEQFQSDKKSIHEYCMENKIKTKRTRGGVSYELKKKGKGALPETGDLVTINYEGFLKDGSTFDKSDEKEPFSFLVGRRKVIEGLDEAIRQFPKGAKGTVLIPSKLAYGPREIEEEGIHIPAHSILIFKIEVLDIKKPEKK